ncbi:MAG: formate dehydrogenase accessory protein FdhE [Bacillota bacterium]
MIEPVFPPQLVDCYRELEKVSLPDTALSLNGALLEKRVDRPILEYAPPVIDREQFVIVAGQVFELLARYLPQMAEDINSLQANLPENSSDRKALIEALLNRSGEAVSFLKNKTVIPPDVFGFAFSHVLRLYLSEYSRRLQEELELDTWGRGNCPVCGSRPNFAKIDATGRRYLFCGLCGTEWRFMRVVCPFCGNMAIEELNFYAVQGDPHRIDVCHRCKGYVKTIDMRGIQDTNPSLFWEDIKTVPLDMTIMQLGFINKTFGADM